MYILSAAFDVNVCHSFTLSVRSRIREAKRLTEGTNRDDFAEHAVAQRVLADHLELVSGAGGEAVDGHLSTARGRDGDSGPVRHPCFTVPARRQKREFTFCWR